MDAVIAAERGYDPRHAGLLAIAGSVTMLLGAGIWATTGTDIDVALVDGGTRCRRGVRGLARRRRERGGQPGTQFVLLRRGRRRAGLRPWGDPPS